jgi:hypothetical protein
MSNLFVTIFQTKLDKSWHKNKILLKDKHIHQLCSVTLTTDSFIQVVYIYIFS